VHGLEVQLGPQARRQATAKRDCVVLAPLGFGQRRIDLSRVVRRRLPRSGFEIWQLAKGDI
jgi:hypothetical protein